MPTGRLSRKTTYADTLRCLNKGLNDAGLTDEVEMSKRTMNGDLLLQLKRKLTKLCREERLQRKQQEPKPILQ